MPDRVAVPAPRGDEAELFRAFNDELFRSVAHAGRASTAEVIEDACAYAWAAFLEHQPDRDGNWRGWLFRSAQDHAWKLEGDARETSALDSLTLDAPKGALESIDPVEFRDDVYDAMSILAGLPERLRQIALLRVLGFHHSEIGALTGLSRTPVHQLAGRASRQVAESLAERHRSGTGQPGRAERLRQLEVDPPDWLLATIGSPVTKTSRVAGQPQMVLAWRRAAIALDDYRRAAGARRSRESGFWRSSRSGTTGSVCQGPQSASRQRVRARRYRER